MFFSIFEFFKIGLGPSSSHTMGPMLAAAEFRKLVEKYLKENELIAEFTIKCTLKGSLALTGKGHATDTAVMLGLHDHLPSQLQNNEISPLILDLSARKSIRFSTDSTVSFCLSQDVIFDCENTLSEHPNGMAFDLFSNNNTSVLRETYLSLGGGFIATLSDFNIASKSTLPSAHPYGFTNAKQMMSKNSGLSIAEMKFQNERILIEEYALSQGLLAIWEEMERCVKAGLTACGELPGGLNLPRRARDLHEQMMCDPDKTTMNDWLSAYAIAVNEQNAAGHRVVTAPTNGAAGVIPAVLYYFVNHEKGSLSQVQDFLLVAASIAGIIKYNSSISGAEVGCQGEVGSAAAMAAAGLCAVRGGSSEQIENAAEIALEHHLGMTCDPVAGLVQIPCIERNAFGAIKAYTAASLALRGTGQHYMSLDNCVEAMRQTGEEMSVKYKETSLGGLAVSIVNC